MQTRLTDQAAQNSGLSQAELERLSTVARQAATAGALELKRLFGRLERIREKGRAGDLVTEADVAAEQAVLTVLSEDTPELGVLAEESGRKEGQGFSLLFKAFEDVLPFRHVQLDRAVLLAPMNRDRVTVHGAAIQLGEQ